MPLFSDPLWSSYPVPFSQSWLLFDQSSSLTCMESSSQETMKQHNSTSSRLVLKGRGKSDGGLVLGVGA